MDSWFNFLYGPLDKKYCNVFLFFSFVSLLSVVLAAFAFIILLFSAKKHSVMFYVQSLWLVAMSALAYLAQRLLYNICLNKQ